ncbi:hypothetical protein GH741_10570 [Aquibacillus halophilus]|uniref:Uncharacterized protein n=1 Tax=Aquibacillus halophilus TaxID=930132 RepID=A0A6A8DBQ4_9BACI|nr:hypothetical protein [Aquibacillus halophilus]
MRFFLLLGTLYVGFTVFYKWRYKILNALLAIRVLRKLIVNVTMNMPYIREKILPSIIGRSV